MLGAAAGSTDVDDLCSGLALADLCMSVSKEASKICMILGVCHACFNRCRI